MSELRSLCKCDPEPVEFLDDDDVWRCWFCQRRTRVPSPVPTDEREQQR